MNTAMTTSDSSAAIAERVMIVGDLSTLTAPERVAYYGAVCRSLGLNPLTKPFDYLTLNNRMVLYAKKDATDQLRALRGVSITQLERDLTDGVYAVVAHASTPDGRSDSSIGAVFIEGLKGDARANAMMKAETKAKRRVTLSICGLGMLDETEVETIPDAQQVAVSDTGEIVDAAPRVVQPAPVDPVVAAAAQNGGVVRTASMGAPVSQPAARDEAIEDWKAAARDAKALGLTQAIDANKAKSTDSAMDILAKAGAIRQAIADYQAFDAATTPAAGEQATLISESPLDKMPA